ncbi:hypothetical protein [Aquimarina algicola]|uniref:Uncharacterized protein n=1 Tax=Aquimarina algicola TaxID=2589995 RepID=A0A504JE57_9FLAO|nr:hypothetical protein [Aquimarina algicola]TPN86932.1 hypothetical protein FHK87_04835 [Aquimarina algicola]
MLKNILNVNGVQKLDKKQQKSVQGGRDLLPICLYTCSGTTATLSNGNYENCAAVIRNSPRCGGDGDGIDIWA